MIFRRIDNRTVVFLDDDHETEVGRVVLPEGGATMAEMDSLVEHLKREAKLREHGAS